MADPSELEPIAARAWRAAEEASLGGWRLYASAGFSGRINACWPLADPGLPLADASAKVEDWYAARKLRPIFKIVEAACAPPGLTTHLAAQGYRPDTETLMMTGALRGAEADTGVHLGDTPDDAFERVFVAAGPGDPGDARERLEALARIVPPRAFARIAIADEPAAIGACAVEGRWAGVFAMRTVPAHRRQGLARRIFDALCAAAHAAGAINGYLQVEAANAPAIALYRAAGFETAYSYRYWRRA